jgi:hypothetical protein
LGECVRPPPLSSSGARILAAAAGVAKMDPQLKLFVASIHSIPSTLQTDQQVWQPWSGGARFPAPSSQLVRTPSPPPPPPPPPGPSVQVVCDQRRKFWLQTKKIKVSCRRSRGRLHKHSVGVVTRCELKHYSTSSSWCPLVKGIGTCWCCWPA